MQSLDRKYHPINFNLYRKIGLLPRDDVKKIVDRLRGIRIKLKSAKWKMDKSEYDYYYYACDKLMKIMQNRISRRKYNKCWKNCYKKSTRTKDWMKYWPISWKKVKYLLVILSNFCIEYNDQYGLFYFKTDKCKSNKYNI